MEKNLEFFLQMLPKKDLNYASECLDSFLTWKKRVLESATTDLRGVSPPLHEY